MSLLSNLRQLKYPREFRIARPFVRADAGNLGELIKEMLEKPPSHTQSQPPAGENHKFLANYATGLWRLRNKMIDPKTKAPLEEMRKPFRHLESLWEMLAESRIEIIEHTNEPYDSGLSIKAIQFQPTPGLNREIIIETIKPTVYYGETKIQRGEVIVGTPEK